MDKDLPKLNIHTFLNTITSHVELKFSNNHLSSVKFKKKINGTCLKDMKEWTEIPKFAIITGPNGSGKSQLLSCIEELDISPGMKLIYLKEKDFLFSFQNFDKKNFDSINDVLLNKLKDNIANYLNSDEIFFTRR